MRQIALALMALVAFRCAFGDHVGVAHRVDLRDANALAQLERSNPRHYARIQKILEGLRADPQRVETGWLEASFDARDVNLQKLTYLVSYPPRQLLGFTLDDTRYTLNMVRTDLNPVPMPAR